MKKQINVFLLLVIVVAIGLLAGMSMLYQERFAVLGQDYLDSSTQLEVCLAELNATEVALDQTRGQLAENVADVDKTVSLFEQKNQELDQARGRIADKDEALSSLEQTITEKDQEIGFLNSEVSKKNKELQQINAVIRDLEQEIEYLREELDGE